MLLEFSASNFRSIAGTAMFSMLAAGKEHAHDDWLIEAGGHRVLPSAVIYGANGSGKSNFIKAIQMVRNLVVGSMSIQPGQSLLFTPHKLSGENQDTEFRILFLKNGCLFEYGFSYNVSRITSERLCVFPHRRNVLVFSRDADSFTAGDKFESKFDNCRDAFKSNRLFLSCAANFSSVKEVAEAFEFFMQDLVVYHPNTESWMRYSLNAITENEQLKNRVTDLLSSLGTGVRGIEVKKSRQSISANAVPPLFADEYHSILMNQSVENFETNVRYNDFSIALQDESSGIQRLVEFLCPFIDIISNGRVLLCDEFEANLHESIVRKFVAAFNCQRSSTGQLIFTTHNTSILNLDTFRRDQIWFTEMQGDGRKTDLYSLAEIRNVRRDENVARGYVYGRYGAIPMLNENFAEMVKRQRQ